MDDEEAIKQLTKRLHQTEVNLALAFGRLAATESALLAMLENWGSTPAVLSSEVDKMLERAHDHAEREYKADRFPREGLETFGARRVEILGAVRTAAAKANG